MTVHTDNLLRFVEPYYACKDIMHDLSHIHRVLRCANRLQMEQGYQADADILQYAAYFHGLVRHHEDSMRTWLKDEGLSSRMIDAIITVAWESQKDEAAQTPEGRILHDAHMIEGGKTFLIVKSLITGSLRGQTLEQTIAYIENNLLDKGFCYLPKARTLYRQQ